jgi:HD superfamily phosphohydrolase
MPIRFPDPVFGQITVPDSLRSIVESPVLSRLRNVRQLGFTLASYPGAVHTRFEHSLGTLGALALILQEFGVTDPTIRDLNFKAALLSEIGIYPLSYSSRSIFRKYGYDKAEYARRVYEAYLKNELKLSQAEEQFVLSKKNRNQSWFQPVMQHKEFAYLDPISLASTVDYVLRDSYYTGRYVGGFDHRSFLSLGLNTEHLLIMDMGEGLRSLHRSVHALNAVYGDPMRRALTRILHLLVERLVESGALDVSGWKTDSYFIELDDDEFLFQIRSAVHRAVDKDDAVVAGMYDVITQRVVTTLHRIKKEDRTRPLPELREELAKKLGTQVERIVIVGDAVGSQIGFRLFGKDYANYAEAINSAEFSQCTGLNVGAQLFGQEASDELFAVIV